MFCFCYSWEVNDSDQPVLDNTAHEEDFSLGTSIKFRWKKKSPDMFQNCSTNCVLLYKDNLFQRELWSVPKNKERNKKNSTQVFMISGVSFGDRKQPSELLESLNI